MGHDEEALDGNMLHDDKKVRTMRVGIDESRVGAVVEIRQRVMTAADGAEQKTSLMTRAATR